MNIREFDYYSNEKKHREVLVLEENNNYVKGLDLSNLDKSIREDIIHTFEHLDSLISTNIESFRNFKVDNIVREWMAYTTTSKIIVSKFSPSSYHHKMTIEEAVEWQKINKIPFKLTGNDAIDEKIKTCSKLII